MGLKSKTTRIQVRTIHEKAQIHKYLAKTELANFVYHCNNLESPFWETTQWYGLFIEDEIVAIAMFGLKYGPTLLATSYHLNDHYQEILLAEIRPYMPGELYSHLNIGAEWQPGGRTKAVSMQNYQNMKLADMSRIKVDDFCTVQRLSSKDEGRIIALLEQSHPDYLLDMDFLAAGFFWGIAKGDELISLAGITGKSSDYGIVSIGSVTTHPAFRQRGLAWKTVNRALVELNKEFETIVLNVKTENIPAIQFYRKLGFVQTGQFREVIFSEKTALEELQ